MKKIIDSIEQVISICGQDFAKWPNKMAPDVLKATYEMLKEYQEQLNHHEVVEIFSESDREQILEKVKSFYENKLAEKDKLASEEAMLRINEYQKLKNKLAEKDRKIDLLLTANKQITYSSKTRQYSQLKKSDVEVKVWCHSCERWVTDDIQDCYCQCTCNFGEHSDYDCIYEEDINAENDCSRNKEWSWQYEISNKQYESLED